MWEEPRNHSAVPSDQEREWMAVRPLMALLRLGAQTLVAVAISVGASHLIQLEREAAVTVAVAPTR